MIAPLNKDPELEPFLRKKINSAIAIMKSKIINASIKYAILILNK
jgi:hypothetical protein